MTTADFDDYEYLEKQLEQQQQPRPNLNGESSKSRRFDKDRDRGDYDKYSSRDSEKDRRSRRRSRSRSRSRKRSSSRDRRHHRSRSRSRGRKSSRRDTTPPEVRLAKEKERELRELERATRTVFAYNLNIRADERDLYEFFSKVGKVMDIKLIMDRNTRKSKGLAYIEFSKQEEVFNALAMTGQLLLGQAIMVKASEAEKNLAWEAQQQAKQSQNTINGMVGQGPCKLHVSNLHPDISEKDLKQLFEPFGTIDSVQVLRDAVGTSQGVGFVTFKLTTEGVNALQHWNGRPYLGSTVLKVQLAAPTTDPMAVPVIGELDEEEDTLKLSAQGRAALMTRLANSAGLQAPSLPTFPTATPLQPQPVVQTNVMLDQGLLGPASPIPTNCLLLKNMFDPTEQTQPGWDREVAEDVSEECSKFGRVLFCHVDKNSKGFVYLKFESMEAAQAAHKALHLRWYSGHQIIADYQFTQIFNNHFKC